MIQQMHNQSLYIHQLSENLLVAISAYYAKPSKIMSGAWGGVVVKALHYQSDPGIDSRWCHCIFQ